MTNTFTLHYNYTLDSNNPTYLGERDFLLHIHITGSHITHPHHTSQGQV
jgi:hypothetical protein